MGGLIAWGGAQEAPAPEVGRRAGRPQYRREGDGRSGPPSPTGPGRTLKPPRLARPMAVLRPCTTTTSSGLAARDETPARLPQGAARMPVPVPGVEPARCPSTSCTRRAAPPDGAAAILSSPSPGAWAWRDSPPRLHSPAPRPAMAPPPRLHPGFRSLHGGGQ